MTLFFDRDLEGFLEALDRTLSLNPRNTNAIAWMAFLLTHMGQHERGYTLVRRGMEINPQHPGWYHFVEVDYHYLRGEYAEALVALKRINMPEMVWMHLLSACVCAQLGRRDEARAAVLLTERMMPAFTSDTERFASHARWFWSQELAAPFHEGYLKALAMAGET
jgi:adenylate cyclase